MTARGSKGKNATVGQVTTSDGRTFPDTYKGARLLEFEAYSSSGIRQVSKLEFSTASTQRGFNLEHLHFHVLSLTHLDI